MLIQQGSGWSVLATFFIAFTASYATAQTPAPNVIYIMLDDLGPGEFSVYDNLQGLGQESKIDTPNINRLANNGMRFNNAHSATSLCAQTRATVMAGAPTWQTNTRWGFGTASLQSGQQSVGDLMQSAGYRTGLMGKGHLGGDIYEVGSNNSAGKDISNLANMDFDRPLMDGMKNHGYDYTFNMIAGIQARPYFFWEDDLATDADADGNSTRITNANKFDLVRQWDANYDDGVTEIWEGAGGIGSVNWKTRDVPQTMLNKAVDFMDDSVTNASNQPFFLHYNSVAGHWPYVAPQDVRVDINDDGDFNDAGEYHEIDGYNGTGPAADDRGTESMQMVSVSDAEVGVIVSYLEQTDDPRNPGHKLIDNTMIIYTSDNGGIGPNYTNQNGPLDRDEWDVYEHDSTAGLRENKGYYYEGGHRVPFIVQWGDNVESGSVRDQRVSNIDLMGTLAGLTGQSLIDQGQGSHNLMPVFTGERDDSDPIRKNTVVEDTGGASDGETTRKLYYQDGWKLSVGASSSTDPTIYGMWNLNDDPAETVDLSSSSDPTVVALRTEMYANYLVERNAVRMAPVFIGRNSAVNVGEVTGYGDVQVEGEVSGGGQVSGDLDVNNGGRIRIAAVDGITIGTASTIVTQDVRLDDDGGQYNDALRLAIGRDSDLDLQRSLIEFDLSQLSLPENATVTDAEIQLTIGFAWGPAENLSPTIQAFPLLQTFDEETATWNQADDGLPWDDAGGDYQTGFGSIVATGSGFDPGTVGTGDVITLSGSNLLDEVLENLDEESYQLILKYNNGTENNQVASALWIDSLQLGGSPIQLVVEYTTPIGSRLLEVAGDYTQRSGSILEVSLGDGDMPGIDYAQLAVSGDIDIMGGEFIVTLDEGFAPELGDSFQVLQFASAAGAFEYVTLPELSTGLVWDLSQLFVTGQLTVVAIPEPASIMLLALMAFPQVCRTRKR